MSFMRGLTIIVADVSSERFRCALSLATAQAALGGKARIFLQGESVSIIRAPMVGWEDDVYADAGQPTLEQLFGESLDLGVQIIVCQSAMQMTGAEPRDFDARVEYGGVVSVMQSLGEDRLVTV